MKRKIIQIAIIPDTTDYWAELFALCDDGTLWSKVLIGSDKSREWVKVEDVPQS